MPPGTSILIQIGILIVPAVVFILAKRRIQGIRTRLVLGALLAIAAGAAAFYLASMHGWQPISRSGRAVNLAPGVLFAINGGSLFLVFIVLTFAKQKTAEVQKR